MVDRSQQCQALLLIISVATALSFSIPPVISSLTAPSCAFVTSVRTSRNGPIATKRRQDLILLHLFALNLFGENDEDDENENVDEASPSPSWVDAIKQWPRYPSQRPSTPGQIMTPQSSSTSLEDEKELLRQASSEDKSNFFSLGLKMPVPLTNLINVEALLMASSGIGDETGQQPILLDNWTSLLLHWSAKSNNSMNNATETSLFDGDSRADGDMLLQEPWSILPDMEELSGWTRWIQTLQRSLTSLPIDAASKVTAPTSSALSSRGAAADSILKEASNRIEFLVSEISSALSPSTIQDLILRASQTLNKTSTDYSDSSMLLSSSSTTPSNVTEASNDMMEAALKLAKQQVIDVREASNLAKETTKFASNLVALANTVLTSGFALKDDDEATISALAKQSDKLASSSSSVVTPKTLFSDFVSARVMSSRYEAQMNKAAEMGSLAGAIYQETIPRTLGLGHSIVANGTTADVVWMVTDRISPEADYREPAAGNDQDDERESPVLVRTFTVRGFDASDESVDRERLLNAICTASPERIGDHVLVHTGLMSVARQIYQDIKQYITWTAPNHRFVFNGHSVGGSIAILLLLLLTEEYGAEFVEERVLRVFTFGSPPVTTTTYKHVKTPTLKNPHYLDWIESGGAYQCDVLKEFNLSPYLVYGFVQPWDPIVRLFSPIDALYPLLGDLGKDGVTLYASGPPRSLRTILRPIVESWEGWPYFRDNFRSCASQNFTTVGVQHILLPEALRYLSDRVVGANVGVPPVEAVLRISSTELLPGLQQVFPMDVFQISFIPAAIRGFIHHFYPAYGDPFVEHASKFAKPTQESNATNPAFEVLSAVATKNDAVQELPSRDDRVIVRNGFNKNRRTELGLGWRGKWQGRSNPR